MKLLFSMLIGGMMTCALSSCHVQFVKSPEDTASGRAAYGDHAPDFRVHKKKNEKRTKQARKKAERKSRTQNDGLYGSRRPY